MYRICSRYVAINIKPWFLQDHDDSLKFVLCWYKLSSHNENVELSCLLNKNHLCTVIDSLLLFLLQIQGKSNYLITLNLLSRLPYQVASPINTCFWAKKTIDTLKWVWHYKLWLSKLPSCNEYVCKRRRRNSITKYHNILNSLR